LTSHAFFAFLYSGEVKGFIDCVKSSCASNGRAPLVINDLRTDLDDGSIHFDPVASIGDMVERRSVSRGQPKIITSDPARLGKLRKVISKSFFDQWK